MKPKFTVAVCVWALDGIGGTVKAAVLFAVELKRRGHRVIFLGAPSPRDGTLAQGDVPRMDPPKDAAAFAEFLKNENVNVIHQHMPGWALPIPTYDALRMLGDQRPRLIETNVFGLLKDPLGDAWVDFRCFVSRASAVQAFERVLRPMNEATLAKATVLTYSLAPLDPISQARARREETRAELDVRPDEILILRIGRAGLKWRKDEVEIFQKARRKNPQLRLLLMEPREDIWREVEASQWGEGILLRRTVSDFDKLAAIYSAGDLMLHMSQIGESFGYTVAEAMQHGLPVITRSTPWCDNAQVELVEHDLTGIVCCSKEGALDAVLRLAGDPSRRAKMGAAAAERIGRISSLERETDLLEALIDYLVREGSREEIIKRNHELLRFQSTFATRENRVWEKNAPGLRFAYLRGAAYVTFRRLQSRIARHFKQAFGRLRQ
jgi:glycosyltransferase involved in cell wall biosynthesis